jgi:hypothetical protein
MSDVYYNPEAFGLIQVAQHDFSDGNYEFDYRVIWEDKDGNLLTARDAGCSCPSPFEDYTRIEDIDKFNLDDLITEANNEQSEHYNGDSLSDWREELRRLADSH